MKASNSQSNKIHNRNVILKMLALNAPISRVALSVMSGLSKMSLTNIISEFIDDGIVVETGLDTSSTGKRKPILLEIADGSLCSIGIHITRSYIDSCISDIKGTILFSMRHDFNGPITKDDLCNLILSAIDAAYTLKPSKLVGIGISAMGPVDVEKGLILNPSNFYGIENVPVVDLVKEHYPDLPVFLCRNTNSAVLAEKYYGYGRNCNNFAYLSVSNGVGCGVLSNDILLLGENGFSCEIGHISVNADGPLCSCGNRGCLEMYSSLSAVRAEFNERRDKGEKTSVTEHGYYRIVKGAIAGDKLANDVLDKQCKYLATGIINLANMFDPAKIIIGSDIAVGGTEVINRLKKFVGNTPIGAKTKPVDIVLSNFYDKAPLLGSAAYVFDKTHFTE